MGQKPAENKKTEILSINLTDGKKSGIRKKIQRKASRQEIEGKNSIVKHLDLDSRDELYNTVLDLALRYCAPLPGDEMLRPEYSYLFRELIVREIVYKRDLIPTEKNIDEMKLCFLFMLQPFSDNRIKKEDLVKKEKILKRFNFGTMFQFMDFLVSSFLKITWGYENVDKNSKTINEQFENIVVETKEMGTKLGRHI